MIISGWNTQSTAANEDADADGVKVAINLRFPGQYFDQESGLNYNYFRNYDASTGRYTISDPIGLAGGINPYTYVGGNPVKKKDPKGLMGFDPGDVMMPGSEPSENMGDYFKNRAACEINDAKKQAVKALTSCELQCDLLIASPCKAAITYIGGLEGVYVYGACNAVAAKICKSMCE